MSDYDGPNELIDAPPLLIEQEAGPEMACPVCVELGDTRDYETGEYLADDCGVCGGTGWLPATEPDAATQLAAFDVEDRGRD